MTNLLLLTLGPVLLPVIDGKVLGRGGHLSLIQTTAQQARLLHSCPQGQLIHCPTIKVSSTVLPNEGQGLVYGLLHQVRGLASSPALMTLEPDLLPAIGGNG